MGAGTIVEPGQIEAAVRAGATFLVSPGTLAGARGRGGEAPVPFLPGVATPSEAMTLRALGFRALKLFPAEAVGGAQLLASLHAPLPDLVFCPTGGIDAAKAHDYLALPNVLCVGGSWMLPKAAIEAGDYRGRDAGARGGRPQAGAGLTAPPRGRRSGATVGGREIVRADASARGWRRLNLFSRLGAFF